MTHIGSLDALFSPRSIAVVGASDARGRIGGVPVDLLRRMGWPGRILPVNPRARTIQGLPAFASLREVGEPIDLAVLAVPQSAIDATMDDAAAAGVRAAVVFTAGFAEVGGEGEAAQRRLSARAREAGIRVVGPNCLGVMNCRERMYATFSPAPGIGVARAGSIGLVSQSGAFGAYAYSLARDRGIGLSVWASTGNEADVQVADVIAWMARDPHTAVIMAYLEGVRDGDRMRRALADAHAARKPVVVVKVGRTPLGAQAAASHTASLAGDDAVYDALFRQYGVHRARDIEAFFDVAHGAAVAGLPRNGRLALFTISGGVGALMADEAVSVGLDVAETAPAAQAEILSWVPFAAPRNPIDITGQVTQDPTLIERAARVALRDGDYGAWLGFMAAAGAGDALWPVFEALVTGLRRDHPDTLLAISTLFSPQRRDRLTELGCLSFAEPADAVRTIGALAWIGAALARPVPPAPGDAPAPTLRLAPGALDEPAALALLASQGVPTVEARVAGPDARIEGALLAHGGAGGVECILGARLDPVFGPVVTFGLGGGFAEVLGDVSIRLAPIAREDALAMVREVRAFPLLDGARGRPRCDLDALADALLALSRFAMAARATLERVDVDPFVAFPRGAGPGGASALALDAVVIGRATDDGETP